jgi:rare lipoprotein A (peptidoglycan hydrolase)
VPLRGRFVPCPARPYAARPGAARFSCRVSARERHLLLSLVLLLFLMLGGCASTVSRRGQLPHTVTPPPTQSRPGQVGRASWYGTKHQGKMTASGEVYNQYDLTAAHPTLPLGSRAVVTNLDNGKTVEVRINDRGPFVDGRVIDLSRGAAQAIGVVKPGTARVRVKTLSPRRAVSARSRNKRPQRKVTPEECASCESQW